MAGRHLCSRRYREFSKLHSILKKEFSDFSFPKMPGKKFFQLSDQQLDARRQGLEQYLEKVCATRVIVESDIMQEFLSSSENSGQLDKVELKILLPDKTLLSLKIYRQTTAEEVYQALVDKLNMNREVAPYFALFEIEEYNFERKLQDHEQPHSLYIENYNTSAATCISLNKWIFSPEKEKLLYKDELALRYLYYLAVEQVNQGQIVAGDRLPELRFLKDAGRKLLYLENVQQIEGYGEIFFPHCASDARKDGHIIAIVGINAFKLQACKEDGTPESQVKQINWCDIVQFEVNPDQTSFNFQWSREGRRPRWVRIHTHFSVFMCECFENVKAELSVAELSR